MRTGFASADRWNKHYADMEHQATEQGLEHVQKHAADLHRLFASTPHGDLWGAWYEWMRETAPAIQDALYNYGLGRGDGSSQVFEAFKRTARGEA